MAKTFDATLNTLIDTHVGDWAAFLASRRGVPPGPATVLDTDLSATLQADRLFRTSPIMWNAGSWVQRLYCVGCVTNQTKSTLFTGT